MSGFLRRSLLACFGVVVPAYLAAVALTPPSAKSLIVARDGDAAERAPEAPLIPAFPYWEHVANRSGFSAVYLGERWVLTAAHVGSGPVVIGTKSYAPTPGSSVEIQRGTDTADLALFRIEGDPGLSALPLSSVSPTLGDPVLMVGFGRGRAGDTEWAGRPAVLWSDGPARRRWGTNAVTELEIRGRSADRHTILFATVFDLGEGVAASEAHASRGDSGGGVFRKNASGDWELFGVPLMVSREPEQPDAAVAGDRTYSADLSVYREEIYKIIGRRTRASEIDGPNEAVLPRD